MHKKDSIMVDKANGTQPRKSHFHNKLRHKLQFYVNALYQCIIRSFRKNNHENEIAVLDANPSSIIQFILVKD